MIIRTGVGLFMILLNVLDIIWSLKEPAIYEKVQTGEFLGRYAYVSLQSMRLGRIIEIVLFSFYLLLSISGFFNDSGKKKQIVQIAADLIVLAWLFYLIFGYELLY